MASRIRFQCSSCGSDREASERLAGRRIRCPECDAMIEVPPPASTADSDEEAEQQFDPYYHWLAIRPDEQPANYYRLLGVALFETDDNVIAISADRQMAHVKAQASGRYVQYSQKLLNELARARAQLLTPERRAVYDEQLRAELQSQAPEPAAPPPTSKAAPTLDGPGAVLRRALSVAEESKPSSDGPQKLKNLSPVAGAASAEPPVRAAQPLKPKRSPEGAQKTPDGSATALPPDSAGGQPAPARPVSPQRVPPQPPAQKPPAQKRPVVVPVAGADVAAEPALPTKTEPARATPPSPETTATSTSSDDEEPVVSFIADRDDSESEMDMTPMVDVTFLLLIFFMVTAAFSLQKSIEMPTPKQDEPSTQVTMDDILDDPEFIVVQVDSYNTYRVLTADWEEEAPSPHDLLIKLRRAREGESGGKRPTKMLVSAHGDAVYEKVIAALDAGTEVGMQEVQVVMTEEDFE